METKNEEWRDVRGFEGLYQVSNLGRVKSLERDIITTYRGTIHTRHYREMILKRKVSKAGYHYVVLCNSGQHLRIGIHRLVAIAFVPGYKEGLIVNHKDENPSNNQADNLEWCNHTYNNTYGNQFKHRYDGRKMKVVQRDASGHIHEYESLQEAARQTGHAATVITRWCKKIHHPQDGSRWNFA